MTDAGGWLCRQAHRVTGSAVAEETCRIVAEDLLAIDVEGVGTYSIMCSPTEATALALGFAYSEGLISGLGDVATVGHCDDDPRVVRMRLARPPTEATVERNLLVVSSCGMCGARGNIRELLEELPPVGDTVRVPVAELHQAAERMHERQAVYSETGAAHAAGIFEPGGEFAAFAEDIGRHTALDKAVGKLLMGGGSPQGCAVVLSGRVSFELVAKCARAGIEVMAAVSAPTSLALEAADRWQITVCGFLRGDRVTVYTHGHRITDLDSLP